jgi:hypothetical protein
VETFIIKNWIRTGVICGLIALVIYPLIIFVSFPINITLLLACAFGILLIVASIGLYKIVSLHKKTLTLQLAVLFNIIACSVVTMMFTIQIALFSFRQEAKSDLPRETTNYIWQIPNIIQLGLDVVWDIFFCIGTFLLAMNMFNHPRFGKIISVAGMTVALLLFVLNIWTFPMPPGESGSIDAGPLTALWYLAATIMTMRSFGWADKVLYERNAV